MTRDNRKEPWKLTYMQRFSISTKLKNTLKKIKQYRQSMKWSEEMLLKRKTRKCWWGVKRYKK